MTNLPSNNRLRGTASLVRRSAAAPHGRAIPATPATGLAFEA